MRLIYRRPTPQGDRLGDMLASEALEYGCTEIGWLLQRKCQNQMPYQVDKAPLVGIVYDMKRQDIANTKVG